MHRSVDLQWEGKGESLRALDAEALPIGLVEAPPLLGADRPGDAQLAGRLAGRVVHGDAIDVARALVRDGYRGAADVVYLDPPFGSGLDYVHEERIDGPARGASVRARAYGDRWEDGPASWLDMMYPRLVAIRPLLGPAGSLWVHVDWRSHHLVRSLCDEIFGRAAFLNEIVWRRAPNLGRQARSGQFGRTIDTIVVYAGGPRARLVPPTRLVPVSPGAARRDPETGRLYTTAPRGDYTDASVARLQAEGRIHRAGTGNVYVKYWLEIDEERRPCKRQPVDALWTDVAPLRHLSPAERTGYPTQKPRPLLERIVACASPPGGLVVDLFAGSGTTGAAAAALGRRFVLGDASPVAVSTMRSRLLREARSGGTPPLAATPAFTVERCGASAPPRGPDGAVQILARAPRPGSAVVELRARRPAEPVAWAVAAVPSRTIRGGSDQRERRGSRPKGCELRPWLLGRWGAAARRPGPAGRGPLAGSGPAPVRRGLARRARHGPAAGTAPARGARRRPVRRAGGSRARLLRRRRRRRPGRADRTGGRVILRDPVHGLVAFESPDDAVVEPLLATAPVQRLRRIRQLGLTSLAFPGAEHTRFSHALGTAFVMKRLLARLRDVEGDVDPAFRVSPDRAREAIAAALLHDVGHGPLSHLFEDVVAGLPPHETWTTRIVLDPASDVHRVLRGADPSLPARVAELVHGRHELPWLARAVSGAVDVDRADYLLRDAHHTGVRYGLYDLDWLLRSLRLSPAGTDAPSLAIDGAKGLAAVESFVLARFFMFQQVYFHKSTRAAEFMMRAVFARACALLRGGARVPDVPAAIATAADGRAVALDDYLALDDGVLLGALRSWEDAPDRILADLCRRLRARSLFKTLDLGLHGLLDPAGRQRAVGVARDLARRAGLDPDMYVGLDEAADVPFSDDGDPLTVVYPRGVVRRPADVSFLLGRLRGEMVARVRLVVAAELRDGVERALGV